MRLLLSLGLATIFCAAYGQTTSWRGTTSSSWALAANWTNGVPTASIDAVVGDANFTGTFHPSVTATSNCHTLTVGGGSRAINLTVNASFTIAGDVNITTLGTITHTGNTTTVRGNWSVTGTYTAAAAAATVVFRGTTQTINNPTTFNRLTINSGSTTSLAANITVTNAFVVAGIFDPVNATNTVTLAGSSFTVNSLGRIKVHATTFSGNYSVDPTLNARGIVEYASSSIDQVVAPLSYGTLTISGGSLKTLVANTTLQSTSGTGGNVNVLAGTLDLGGFTLNRNAAGGGTFAVSNGAQLNIGGTNSFPANYNTTTLGASSTVLYGGDNQTITSKTYGHLIVSGVTGTVVKTFPATAMTIAGNFSSIVGTATSMTLNANAAITITGNISIGASTTFNGGTATHILAGNWTNDGIFNGNTSTVRFNGATRVISGAGIQNFNNITVAGTGVTCSSADLTLTGNLATTGSGTFTHNTGSTVTFSGTAKTIGGPGINLFNVIISGSISTNASFTINGDFTGNGIFNATAGTITFSGATAVINGTGTTTFFGVITSGALNTAVSFSMRSNLSGAGKLTATAGTLSFIGTSTVSGTHDLFNVTVNGTRLQLGANATVSVAGALTITSGTLNTTTTTPNTLIYNGPGNQSIAAATYYNLRLTGSGIKTAAGAILPRGDLTINSGVTFNASAFTHTVGGNWINLGTFTPATSTVTFNGASNTTITGATTFNTLTLNKSTATTTLTLNSSVNATALTMINGRMLTGFNAVTITGTRTGNGTILGTIIRTHAFVANTSYAFESPNNTINFTSIAGTVTSVTVTVLSAPVADFPSLNSVNRSYNISVLNTGTYVATLRLHYDDTELNGDVEANLNLWRFVTGAWTSYGKTSSDVTNNWVQRTAQSDVTGRWTFFDGSVTHTWKGTTNSAWATASNWKAGVVPQGIDNILIGTETFTNQPNITTAITAKSIVFGSAKAVTLTVGGAAGSLTVNGNIGGDWLADQTHTINVGTRSLVVGGDLTLSNGNAARKIQLTLSSGSASVAGSVIQPGAGSIVFSGNGNISIGIDYNYSGGSFTAGTGTVTYNGTADQVIAGGVVYNNLIVSKPSGTATLAVAGTINSNFTISGSSEVTLDAQLNVSGNVSTIAGTILNMNAPALTVAGNWSFAGTLNATTGSVVFNGTGNQNISQSSFNDLVINKAAGIATLSGNIAVAGGLTITSGTFDIGSFTANSSTGGGTFLLNNGTTLRLSGASNFPSNYDTQTISDNSSVVYNGATQNIAAISYSNLILSNAGTKSFSADTPTEATNLTISVPASLPASATLRLRGNLINNGSFNIASGSVIEFNGTATQTISGTSVTDFSDIIVFNTASPGVSIESNQNLLGVLTLQPNVTLDADGSTNTSILRLISAADNPAQDAAIATIPIGAAVLGNVTVQRYMSIEGPAGRTYRYVSSPVQNGAVADIQNEIPVTGPFTGTSVCSKCTTSASMFGYDETVITGGINGGYFGFPISSNAETLQPGRGYSMFVRGNLLSTALWDIRGPVNSGAIDLPVSFTSSGTTGNDGWNLVGNPYPSTIDWNASTGWQKTNIGGTIYIRDNSTPVGQYATWNGVVGTNGGSQYIAAGQGFWVKASGTLPSLSMDENVKVAGIQTTFFRQAEPDNLLRITLSQGNTRDEAVIHFRIDASSEFDEEADALKIHSTTFNLSSQLAGEDKLAINSLDLSSCSRSVPLALDSIEAGTYMLSFDNVNSFTPATSITLVDNFTHTTIDTRLNPTYSFSITGDDASLDSARFVINFSMQPAPLDYSIAPSSSCPGSDAQIELANTSDLVNYQVMVNGVVVFLDAGNGGTQSITLPADMLQPGENPVNVAAMPYLACGILTERSTTLTVATPEQPTTASGEIICRNGSTTLKATGARTGEQYRWYSSMDGDMVLGTDSNYTTSVLSKSHTYYVSVASGSGCESERIAVQASVLYFDDPVITLDSDKLVVDYPGNKQWYFNNELLPNDTSSVIVPAKDGVYSVTIPVGSCLAQGNYPYSIEGLAEETPSIHVYPNPSNGEIYFSDGYREIENVIVRDLSGRVAGRFTLGRQHDQVTGKYDMKALPAGMYFLVIEFSDGRVNVVKVIRE